MNTTSLFFLTNTCGRNSNSISQEIQLALFEIYNQQSMIKKYEVKLQKYFNTD